MSKFTDYKLKSGKYYHVLIEKSSYEYIVKYNKSGMLKYIDLYGAGCFNTGNFNLIIGDVIIKRATVEQKSHLKECIKQNEYIVFEYSNNEELYISNINKELFKLIRESSKLSKAT